MLYWVKWVAIFLCLAHQIWGKCDCGRGGLCIKEKNELVGGKPCNCESVSKGIFKKRAKYCDELEDVYCDISPCYHDAPCYKGFGTYICDCSLIHVTQNCKNIWELATSRKFFIWYPIQGQTQWEYHILIELLLKLPKYGETNTMTIYFEDGRQWNKPILTCNVRKSMHSMTACAERGGGEDCNALHYMISKAFFYYGCLIPLPYSLNQGVYVQGIAGPVGHYHDVRIVIQDAFLSNHHLEAMYRVFLETGEMNRRCPIKVELIGCSEKARTAPKYMVHDNITLTARAALHDPENKCHVKTIDYRWSITPFRRRGHGRFHPIASTPTITFRTIDYFYEPNLYTMHCDMTFIGVVEETVSPVCFIQVKAKEPQLSIDESDLYYTCETPIKVSIDALLNQNFDVQEMTDMTFAWECPQSWAECLTRPKPHAEYGEKERVLQFWTGSEPCGASYEIKLRIIYSPQGFDIYDPLAPKVVNRYREYSWTGNIKFVDPEQYNLRIQCDPNCINVNPTQPLTLTVTNMVSPLENFTWYSVPNITKFAWDEMWSSRCNFSVDEIYTIPAHALQPSTNYTFTVESERSKRNFTVQTASKPRNLSCTILPESGDRLTQQFNISCSVESSSPILTYYVAEGRDQDLISITQNNYIEVVIAESPVWITVVDHMGLKETISMKLHLTATGIFDRKRLALVSSIASRMKTLPPLLHEHYSIGIARVIDFITRIDAKHLNMEWRLTLMKYLAHIRQCYWRECIEKTLNSLRRLMGWRRAFQWMNTSECVYFASYTLYTMSKSLYRIVPKTPRYAIYNMNELILTIQNRTREMLDILDHTIVNEAVDEDIRQIHYRRMLLAITYARKTLTELGLFIARHIPHPAYSFTNRVGYHSSINVFSHVPEYINCALRTYYDSSYFQFSADMVEYLRVNDMRPTVVVIPYNIYHWWHGIGNVSFGGPLDIYFYARKGEGGELKEQVALGGVQTYIGPVSLMMATIHENVPLIGYFKSNAIPMIFLYRIVLDRGQGSLIVFFPESLIGHIFFSYDITFPINYSTYDFTYSEGKRYVTYNYYNNESGRFLYMGISNHLEVESVTFNMTIVKCLIKEQVWKGESCIFTDYRNNSVHCTCNSWGFLGALSYKPRYTAVQQIEIHVGSSRLINWKAILKMLAILFIPLVVLIVACYTDRRRNLKETVMLLDDNWPGDEYPYLVAVFTGARCMSGTSANVAIRIMGDRSASRVHILKSSGYVPLRWTRDSWFILLTAKDLGNIEQIQMWHDNGGIYPNWYCTQVMIWDITSGRRCTFYINEWLSYSQMNTQDVNSLTFEKFAGKRKWQSLARRHMMAMIPEEHHWASVFVLHPRSIYTHTDRALLLIVVVFVALASTIGFYMNMSGHRDRNKINLNWFDVKVVVAALAITLMIAHLLSQLIYIGRQRLLERDIGKFVKPTIKHKLLYWIVRPVTHNPVLTAHLRYNQLEWNKFMTIAYCVSVVIAIACSVLMVTTSQRVSRDQGLILVILSISVCLCEALVINLIQILLMSLLISYVTKLPPANIVLINIDLVMYIQQLHVAAALSRALHHRVKSCYKPPLRSNIMKTAKSDNRRSLFDPFYIIAIIFVYILVFLIAYLLGDHHYVSELTHISSESLNDIQNPQDYYNFMRETVVKGLNRFHWYNGKPLLPNNTQSQIIDKTNNGFGADYSTKLIGVLELRQQRVAPEYQNPIPTPFRGWFPRADGALTLFSADTVSYHPSWKPQTPGIPGYTLFEYSSSEETKAGVMIGPSRFIYDGSGYVERLHWRSNGSRALLTSLQFDSWVDNATRIIFCNFNLFNLNDERITILTIITECLPSGVYRSRIVARSLSLTNELMILIFAMLLLLVITLHFIRMVALLSRVRGKGWTYSLEHSLGLAIVFFGYLLVMSMIYRYLLLCSIMDEVESAPRDHHMQITSRLNENDVVLVLFGVFILIVATFGCSIAHNLICFEGAHISSIRLKEMFVGYCYVALLSSLFALYAYHISSARIRFLFFSLLFKELAPVADNIRLVWVNPNHLTILFPLVMVLARCNISIFARFYAESIAPFETKTKMFERFSDNPRHNRSSYRAMKQELHRRNHPLKKTNLVDN